jgi:hypothetical protein
MKTAPFLVAAAFTVCAVGLAPAATATSPECANMADKLAQLETAFGPDPSGHAAYDQLCGNGGGSPNSGGSYVPGKAGPGTQPGQDAPPGPQIAQEPDPWGNEYPPGWRHGPIPYQPHPGPPPVG